MSRVQDILKNFRETGSKNSGNGVRALTILWKKAVGETYGGFQKALTNQEVGQLKMFAGKCGEGAYRALDWALHNWDELAFEVKQRYGLTVAPERPVVGFVLKYHDVVVDVSQSSAKPHHEPVVVATPATTAPTTAAPKEPESKPQKATQAQVAAALAKLKSG